MLISVILLFSCAGKRQNVTVGSKLAGKTLQVQINPGLHWKHAMPIMGFIKLQNRPQMAIWLEDENGKFIQNIYVTRKSATQGWLRGPGDPTPKDQIHRYESLPYWMYKQNMEFAPGVLMPTATNPLPKHITSATPKGAFQANTTMPDKEKFYVVLEINQSTDFNDYYSKEKSKGSDGYSGGTWGSGQPSVIYRAQIDCSQPKPSAYQMKLVGHGSANGSDGNLNADLSRLTTAISIISSAEVSF
jgi:hypothetical protein